jgi:hypothetical protein
MNRTIYVSSMALLLCAASVCSGIETRHWSTLPVAIFHVARPIDAIAYATPQLHGNFTWAGPLSLSPLAPDVQELTFNPSTGQQYGVGFHRAVKLDPTFTTATEIPEQGNGISGDVAYTTGITYDPVRQRLVVSSLDSEGALYAINPLNDQWSVIAGLKCRSARDRLLCRDRLLLRYRA